MFALEDLYGLKIELVYGEAVLRVDSKGTTHPDTPELITAWAEQATKYKAGEYPNTNTISGIIIVQNMALPDIGTRFRHKNLVMEG